MLLKIDHKALHNSAVEVKRTGIEWFPGTNGVVLTFMDTNNSRVEIAMTGEEAHQFISDMTRLSE
jgi:hypothetical protein